MSATGQTPVTLPGQPNTLTRDAALAAHGVGLCVVPPTQDGVKRPDVKSWTEYQTRQSTIEELDDWYGSHTGIGIVTGAISGIEMLEFEGRAVEEGIATAFGIKAREQLGDVLERVMAGYLEMTPTGGYHLVFRVETPLPNTVLASRQATAEELEAAPGAKARVLIETRGEGGYTITAPSNGRVHPTGKPWVLVQGGFDTIATIKNAERDALYALAETFDRMPVVPPRKASGRWEGPSDSPIGRYNSHPDAERITEELLVRHGWTVTYRRGSTTFLRRPGKEHGHSATLGHYPGAFFVFSGSTEFVASTSSDPHPYDPAGALAVLEYGGDARAMGKALAEAAERRWDTGTDARQAKPEPEPEPQRDPGALARCVATFRQWLHLPDPGALYVSLATVAANRAEGDPVWTLVVSPPGGGKTEVIQPLAVLRDVHQAATLTEAALLSGTPAKDRDQTAKGGLLRIIGDFGIILCKVFGSVLSMNRDSRAALLAALREVYDGSWTRHVGTDGGRTLAWSGKVGFIGGCTPAIDSQHAVIGSMGERFILYRLPPVEAEAQVRRALGHVGKEQAMRQALGQAVTAVLEGLDAGTARGTRRCCDSGPAGEHQHPGGPMPFGRRAGQLLAGGAAHPRGRGTRASRAGPVATAQCAARHRGRYGYRMGARGEGGAGLHARGPASRPGGPDGAGGGIHDQRAGRAGPLPHDHGTAGARGPRSA